jgi:hypothetical protein
VIGMHDSTDRDRLRSLGLELRDYLVRARKSVDDEIRTYPTPIPRCDAQFNFVYEQRSRLSELLNPLNAALDHGNAPIDFVRAMAAFMAAPPGESLEERDLRKRIAANLSAASGLSLLEDSSSAELTPPSAAR